MELNNLLEKRYATKRMTGQLVPDKDIESILRSIQLAPTSLGLQALKVFAISDKDTLKEISEKSCQQPQIMQCSHLLVFAARNEITDAEISDYMNLISTTRNIPVEALSDFRVMIESLKGYSAEDFRQWSSKQTYILLGFGLVAAAALRVDSTPMEGFDKDALDEILNLGEQGLHTVVMLALGYRDEKTDYLVNAAKVRKPINDLVSFI